MHTIHAVILGIVEGITEFLPVSSTGHLILASKLLKVPQTDFLKSFEIIIQLGAILSVIVLYYKLLCRDWNVIKKLAAAFIPTGIVGFLLYKTIKRSLLGNSLVVFWSLILGGIFIIVFELLYRPKETDAEDLASISYRQAVAIGLFQAIAVIPGVSRSAATIIGGLFVGVRRRAIVEFSFLLAIPTMLAATVFDLSKNASTFSGEQLVSLGIGFLTSFVVALFAIKFFLAFIQKHSFIVFGVYRILIALAFLFALKFLGGL